ncbi:NAD-dependent protein deacylase [Leuconostoc gasicomitatum]|uniref:NAD-dependent protein deacylase n=1 Tax=Leuconostoc gasicomitatum TaxID=115778 RepID=UPI000BC4D964|nr:NAD-dependent protein deacylase [Leuconostoc gasicomitatum]MBZ5944274.1 NAD-dependent protein deacylase [Leuconostoc gasicomitatum]MBZ5950518.1 NAD-dependent protein deacylase [Leuconostoc gasicomitatum]MBZ5950768.1 NAD-dependent protein deacylase [Leuconostoc gasicomitatum]MBZ5967738.1 NAD-dependent protein deacylase [Leuconostoc gasicomitatum]MBZ5972383.1 NAD-dependent protein deacylase [Leuconostoc gasicomitatum]
MLVTPKIQERFDSAKQIVFMTGAGVSTASGIPDYRSKNGIYNGVDLRPEYLLSKTAFRNEPEKQYQFMIDNMYFPMAKPNIIHDKMAELTQHNKAKIITQNVDDLHVKANSKPDNLVRFHGSLYDIYAPIDGEKTDVMAYLKSMTRLDGAVLRPNITFYEEMPFDVDKSVIWVQSADLIVVVGTSFRVYPFAGLLNYANTKATIMSINLEHIETSFNVDQIIGDATDFFDELKI